jgi:hypothetical protein
LQVGAAVDGDETDEQIELACAPIALYEPTTLA